MTSDGRRLPDWFRSKRSRMSSCEYYNTNSDTNSSSSSSSSPFVILVTTASLVSLAYVGYEIHRSCKDVGWEGTLRWIWDGDPYDPELRDALERLEKAEFDRTATHHIEDRLRGLEESLDMVTTSMSCEENKGKLWNDLWMDHASNNAATKATPLTVERTLADMSDRLDKIAARIDDVVLASSSNNPFLVQKVKQRRKILSKTIVADMERCDALVASFQVFKEQSTKQYVGILE